FWQKGFGLSPSERRHMLAFEYGAGGSIVATYVLLTKVTAAGVKTVQSNPRRIKKVNEEIEAMGARVVAQYATLGRYDFVNIVEAKDVETVARVSVGLGARGTVQIETLSAIPIETFIRTIGRKANSGVPVARRGARGRPLAVASHGDLASHPRRPRRV